MNTKSQIKNVLKDDSKGIVYRAKFLNSSIFRTDEAFWFMFVNSYSYDNKTRFLNTPKMYQYLALEFAKIGQVTYQERIWYVTAIWKTCQISHIFSSLLWMVNGVEFSKSGPLFSTLTLYEQLKSSIEVGPNYRDDIRMFKTHFICGFLLIFSPREFSPLLTAWIDSVFTICNININTVLANVNTLPILPYPDMNLDCELYTTLTRYFYNAIEYEMSDFPVLPQCYVDTHWDYREPELINLSTVNNYMMLDIYQYDQYRANMSVSTNNPFYKLMLKAIPTAPLGRDRIYWYNLVGNSQIVKQAIQLAFPVPQAPNIWHKRRMHEELLEEYSRRFRWKCQSQLDADRFYHCHRFPSFRQIYNGHISEEMESWSDVATQLIIGNCWDDKIYEDYIVWYHNSDSIITYQQYYYAVKNPVSDNVQWNLQFYSEYFFRDVVYCTAKDVEETELYAEYIYYLKTTKNLISFKEFQKQIFYAEEIARQISDDVYPQSNSPDICVESASDSDATHEFIDMNEIMSIVQTIDLKSIERIEPQSFSFSNIWQLLQGKMPDSYKESLKKDFSEILKGAFDIVTDKISDGAKMMGKTIVVVAIILWLIRTIIVKSQNTKINKDNSWTDTTPRREKVMKYALILILAAISIDGGTTMFERWKAMTFVSPQSSVVDFITVAISSLTFIREWKTVASPKFVDALAKIGRSKQGLTEILESMHLLFRQYLSPVFSRLGWYNPAITKLGISAVDDFFLQMDHIEQASRQGGLKLTYGNRRMVDGTLAVAEQLMKTSKQLNLHKEVVSLIVIKMRVLAKLRDKFDEANIKPDTLRQETIGFMIVGAPNTRKTEFTVDFATFLAGLDCITPYEREMFKTNPDVFIYVRTVLNEFWDDFSETIKVIVSDDFQQAKDAEVNQQSEVMELLRIINRFTFDTHQASLEKKGNVKCYSKFFVGNTNRDNLYLDQVYSKEAILRRLNFIKVRINRKYSSNPQEVNADRVKPDNSKLPRNELNQTYIPLDFWDLYIKRNDTPNRGYQGPFSMEQLFHIVQDMYLEKRAHYEANVIQRQHLVQSSLEYFQDSHWYDYMETSNDILHHVTENMILKECKGRDPAKIKTLPSVAHENSAILRAYQAIREEAAEKYRKSEVLLTEILNSKYSNKKTPIDPTPQAGSIYEDPIEDMERQEFSLVDFNTDMRQRIFGKEEPVEDLVMLDIDGMEESYGKMKEFWDSLHEHDRHLMQTKITKWLDSHNFDKNLFFWKKDGHKINSYLCVLSALHAENPQELKNLIDEKLSKYEVAFGLKYDFTKHLSRFELLKQSNLPNWLISLTEFVIDGWSWLYRHPLVSLIVTFGGVWAIGEFLLNDSEEPGYSMFPFTMSDFQNSWWYVHGFENGIHLLMTVTPQPYDYGSLLHQWLLVNWDDPDLPIGWKDLSLAKFDHDGKLPKTPSYEEYLRHKMIVEKCADRYPVPQSKAYEGPRVNQQKPKPKGQIKQISKVVPQDKDNNGMQIFTSVLSESSIDLYRIDEVQGKEVKVFITHCFALTGRLIVIPYHMLCRLKSVYRDGKVIPGTKFSFVKKGVMIYQTTVENLIYKIDSNPGPLVEHDLCGLLLPPGQCFRNRISYFLTYQDIANLDYLEVYVWTSDAKALQKSVTEINNELKVTKNWVTEEGEPDSYIIPKVLKYHIDTQSGDCGVPVFLSKASAGKARILGFHSAGVQISGLGYASLVPRELIQEFADHYYQDEIPIVPSERDVIDSLVEPQCQTNWLFEGTSPVYYHRINRNHDIIPSPLQSLDHEAFVPKCAPAPLEPFDGISPLRLAIQKHGENKISDTWTEEQRICIDLALDSIAALVSNVEEKPRLLSWEEALWGNPDDPYINAIKSSSSPGVRLKSFSSPMKEMLMGEGMHRDARNPHLADFIKKMEQVEDDAAKGIRWLWLYSVNLKAERLPLEKVLAGKARAFFGADFECIALINKYFGAFAAEFFRGGLDLGHFTNGNPMSGDWRSLYEHLNSLSEDEILQLAAGDYSGFDTSHLVFILYQFGVMINKWYNDGIRNQTIRMVLFMEIIAPRLIIGCEIFVMMRGMCSGNGLTPIINNLWNHFIFRYVFFRITRENGWTLRFEENCILVVVGDDNIWTVRKFLRGVMNEITVGKYMLELGCKYTSETKGESTYPFRNYTDVEFLKRRFRFDSEFQMMMSPIRWDTISEMILWTKKKDSAAIFVTNVYESILESSLYGREVYETYCRFIRKELQKLNKFKKVFKFQSWSDAVNGIYLRAAEIRRLENANPQSNWAPQQINLANMKMSAQESDNIHTKEVEPSEVSTSQIDIVGFNDDAGMAIASPVEQHRLRLVAQPVSVNDNSIIGFMERPIKVKNGSFANGDGLVMGLDPYPYTLLTAQSSMLLSKLKGVYGFAADLEFTLVCNSNKFVQGLYTLSWVPKGGAGGVGTSGEEVAWYNSHTATHVQRSQLPHVNINLACDTKVILTIPYSSKQDFFSLQSVHPYRNSWGSLNLWPTCTESGYETYLRPDTASANWTLYARFTNVKLIGATAMPQSNWTDQVLPQSEWKEQKSKNAGPVESVAVAVSNTASFLSNAPVLGDYVKPIKWVSDAVAKTANVFGWSRPLNLSTPHQIKRRPFYGTNNVDDMDNSQKVALSSTNTVSVLPGFGGTDIDELDLVNFSKRKSIIKPIHWGTGDAVGTLLQYIVISPGTMNYVFPTATSTYHPSPLSFAASCFSYWRGSISIKVTFGKTTFHSGRLLVTFCPYSGKSSSPPGMSEENYMYREIIDMREQTEFTVTVPFLSNTLWKSVGGPTGDILQDDTCTGRLDIYVLDKLVCPPNVPTDIYGIVEGFAGDDIEFAVPAIKSCFNPCIDNVTPQSAWPEACEIVNTVMPGMSVSNDGLYAKQTSIGENITNFRSLLKRFQVLVPQNDTGALASNDVWCVVPNLIRANAGDVHMFTPDLYSQLGSMFMYSRGSVRIKYVTPTVDTNSYLGAYWLSPFIATNVADYAQYEYAYPIKALDGSNTVKYSYQAYNKNLGFANYKEEYGAEVEFPQYTINHSRNNMEWLAYKGAALLSTEGYDSQLCPALYFQSHPNVAKWQLKADMHYFMRAGGDDCNFGGFVSIPPCLILGAIKQPA